VSCSDDRKAREGAGGLCDGEVSRGERFGETVERPQLRNTSDAERENRLQHGEVTRNPWSEIKTSTEKKRRPTGGMSRQQTRQKVEEDIPNAKPSIQGVAMVRSTKKEKRGRFCYRDGASGGRKKTTTLSGTILRNYRRPTDPSREREGNPAEGGKGIAVIT